MASKYYKYFFKFIFNLMKTTSSKLVIRFRRRGYTKYAIFEIVVASSSKRSFIEKLGFFNPQFSERLFFIDSARVTY